MRSVLAVLLLLSSVSLSCWRQSRPEEGDVEVQTETGGSHGAHGARHQIHEARGTVLWHEDGRVYLNHEEIPGFMDAMAMGFDVRDDALLTDIEAGTVVEFRVIVEADGFYIDQIRAVE